MATNVLSNTLDEKMLPELEAEKGLCSSDDYSDSGEDDYENSFFNNEYSLETKDFSHSSTGQRDMSATAGAKTFQPRSLDRFSNNLELASYYQGPKMSSSTLNSLNANMKKAENDRMRVKDKMDRATVEQVLDPRTRMILYKLLNKHAITGIDGCISTGKEANVYHATDSYDRHLAIKIYKTSILTFKDRDKYVSGEFRWRHGYSRHNPRKMVRTWAEKEMRNLARLRQGGVNVPEPVILRGHVLIMEFMGEDGWPSPKLKEVDLSETEAVRLYRSCCLMMRRMFRDCRLVHADLSEFNILYHKGELCIIDVSQSVEHDHPHSLEFLRTDCTNMTSFFQKAGALTLTVRELFEYVVQVTERKEGDEEMLDRMVEEAQSRGADFTEQEKVTEEVFKKSFIPQKLNEVIDAEKDVRKVTTGHDEDLLYKNVAPVKTGGALEEEESSEELEDEENENEEANMKTTASSARPRDESQNSKKERKKAVREEKKEKRQHKVPKHVKKRHEKLAKDTR
ncbi:hypothetical protein RvY_10390 [Ramazzottius varieornatus]|uniref:Serine/threonine-protein kinase RIO1 n=1 Tax=Ramazzottius varieornatus TaxID=947166 RepID=A0A1D1VCK6_RAMVA|nr:hypothetical protein RvY_10390 [Ramazzottius varieornatus]